MISGADREILVALLLFGDNTPGNVSELIDRHSQTAQKRLKELETEALVANKGAGVYRLTIDGVQLARSLVIETGILSDLDPDLSEYHPDHYPEE